MSTSFFVPITSPIHAYWKGGDKYWKIIVE